MARISVGLRFAALTCLAAAAACAEPVGDKGGKTSATSSTGGQGGEGAGTTSASGGGGSGGTGGAGGSGGEGGVAGGGGASPIGCGDGTADVEIGEQCDDGNTTSGDGCDKFCAYELVDGCPTAALALGTTEIVFDGDSTNSTYSSDSNCGGDGNETVVKIQPAVDGTLYASAGSFYFIPRLWLSAVCPSFPAGTELTCDSSPLTWPVQAGSTYYLGVDATMFGQGGTFTLNLVIVQ
jgi:cysteine-rich repeat protein